MKCKHLTVFASIVALMVLVVSLPPVFGEPPEGKGNKKGDVGMSVEGFLYGDLYVIERDGNGQPILYGEETSCYDANTGMACAQPLMDDCSYVPLVCSYFDNGDWQSQLDDPIPDADNATLRECLLDIGIGNPLDPEAGWEPELCDLHPCFLDTIQEVHFGRLSVARTTPDVVEKAYDEALSSLNSALGVSQDLAGRIVLDLPLLDEFGDPVLDANGFIVTYAKTIDSPLENLALYREMMTNECLGEIEIEYIGEGGADITEIHYLEQSAIDLLNDYLPLKPLVCPYDDPNILWEPTTPDGDANPADHSLAAVFLAAAADKAGHITLDMLVNANTYLEINGYEEPDGGNAPILTYHEFGADSTTGWFEYNQDSTYAYDASATLLVPSASCGEDCFCVGEVSPFQGGLLTVDFVNAAVPVCRGGELLREGYSTDEAALPYYCRQDMYNSGLATVFSLGENSVDPGCGGANWFTQAAEDARQVIWFLHNWSVPE